MIIKTVKKFYNLDNNFSGYEVTNPDNIVYSVPLDPANTDYQDIQKWIKEGGVVIDNPPTE
jgi:hypothetical protein